VSYAIPCQAADKPADAGDRLLGEWHLPIQPQSVAVARRLLVDVARAWGVTNDVVETAELLCSELVTNAVVHAKWPPHADVVMSVIRDEDRLIVECRDPSREIPQVLSAEDPLSETGRGLWLVKELAYDCGVHLTEQTGKSVWFELLAWPAAQ
jgi:anti-sigma regulatory factor (Ser/Thr protein kinase)